MEKEEHLHTNSIIPSSIENRIFTIGGEQVMVERDLAERYHIIVND